MPLNSEVPYCEKRAYHYRVSLNFDWGISIDSRLKPWFWSWLRPVHFALLLLIFYQTACANDTSDAFLDDHTPKVPHCSFQRTLRRDHASVSHSNRTLNQSFPLWTYIDEARIDVVCVIKRPRTGCQYNPGVSKRQNVSITVVLSQGLVVVLFLLEGESICDLLKNTEFPFNSQRSELVQLSETERHFVFRGLFLSFD